MNQPARSGSLHTRSKHRRARQARTAHSHRIAHACATAARPRRPANHTSELAIDEPAGPARGVAGEARGGGGARVLAVEVELEEEGEGCVEAAHKDQHHQRPRLVHLPPAPRM
eukprot:2716751-Rhodomonas_salina.1